MDVVIFDNLLILATGYDDIYRKFDICLNNYIEYYARCLQNLDWI